MPELQEEMYCHQQICIPPSFPYLLRQYAKAAIRSQPTDLLKWSTAYFRCLALNVPPPVKPRLEYPIPRDYIGVTPGWLRALNYQLQGSQTVSFRVLWDRWMGSCLEHNSLIQILCLAGFNNPDAIPWTRFLGVCAGFLNDNLTQTMIMICEILTEEPEGGSAMIPLEIFLDVYKFLACIDASQPQILPNLYFTDESLALYEKEKKKRKKKIKHEEVVMAESSSSLEEEVVAEQEAEVEVKAEESVISCPDIAADEDLKEPEPEEDAQSEDKMMDEKEMDNKLSEEILSINLQGDKTSELGEDDILLLDEKEEKDEEKDDEEKDQDKEKDELREDALADDVLSSPDMPFDEPQPEEQPEVEAAEETKAEQPAGPDGSIHTNLSEQERAVLDDRDAEEEYLGFGDEDELERAIRAQYAEYHKDLTTEPDVKPEELMGEEEEEERKIEQIQVPAVPGIGPPVPNELVEAVARYLTRVAADDQGMTMPRHIRHYSCPPLEVYD